MNTWRTWAERLRARHSRREGSRSLGRLVFARGARFVSQTVNATSRTVIHVRPHLNVTMRLVTPALLARRVSAVVPSGMLTLVHGERSAGESQGLRVRPIARPGAPALAASSLTFVEARHVRSTLASVERRVERLHRVADRWGLQPAAAIGARELPGRVRRRLARKEMSMPDQVHGVAMLHHRPFASPQASPEASSASAERSRMRGELAVPAPAAPAIDVEALTSQVIHRLDRRLVAYRERMGRG